jgi:hypothetical protein
MTTQQKSGASDFSEVSFFQKCLALAALVLWANCFFFYSITPFGFGLQLIGWLVFVVLVFVNRSNLGKYSVLLAGLAVITTSQLGLLVVRGSSLAAVLSLLSLMAALSVSTYVLASGIPFIRSLMELLFSPFLLGLAYLAAAWRTFVLLISRDTQQKMLANTRGETRSIWKSGIVGFIIGLPIVAALVSMFTAADPIFAKFVSTLLGGDFLHNLPARLTTSLLIVLVGGIVFNLRRSNVFYSPLNFFQKFSVLNEVTVVMTMVALTIGLFLAVQWPYVFVKVAKETQLADFGVATYSEYVKKGFGELTKAAVFIFALAWLGMITIRDNRARVKKMILPYVQLFILAEFVVFQISILRRIWLYQGFHGWTLAKIYGGLFVVVLLGLTVTLALRHLWTKRWIVVEVCLLAVSLVAVSWFNAEHFIVASKHWPTVNERIDYMYLAHMSSDGVAGWRIAYDWADQTLLEKSALGSEIVAEGDRREIAYAGMVVSALSSKYLNLLETQATSEEYRAAYVRLLQTELQEKEAELLNMQNRQAALQLDLATQSATLSQQQVGWRTTLLKDMENESIHQKKQFDDMTAQLRKAEDSASNLKEQAVFTTDYQSATGYANSGYFDFTQQNEDGLCQRYSDITNAGCSLVTTNFYSLTTYGDKVDSVATRDKMEKLLHTNWANRAAFELLHSDITLERLLQLQKRYFELRTKVAQQPSDQRAYEADVSLNSPFISR